MLIILFLLSLLFHSELFVINGDTMHTYYQVKICDKKIPQNLKTGIEKILTAVENQFSSYALGNKIAEINKNAGIRAVKVSPQLCFVIKKAVEIAQQSDSAFDPTIGPLIDLWNFRNCKQFPPSSQDVRKVKQLVNWRELELENCKVFLKKKGMKLQLSGIAKGYGIDLVADFLKKSGIKNAMVEIGGDIYCFGKGPNGKNWRIGIRDPLHKERLIAEISVTDVGIATSGNYENCIWWRGKRYGHLIDPRTGYPVDNKLESVTIIAPTCIQADAWATAVFVLGWEEGRKVIVNRPQLEGVIIRKTNGHIDIWTSPGIRDKIILYGN
ncbi:MAG TPA: FAD:protein FMN transferase [Candidatus Omnitrophica bacterium]|nr:FAD:protein FMN transferase [Candidatus Omnitrophota bacterium]